MLRPCTLVGWALLWAGLSWGAEGDAVAELSTFDNAAYNYWRAAALIQEVLTEGEFDAVIFAEQELPRLPPKAFAQHPTFGRWLLNERLMLEALHAGASRPHCMFVRPSDATSREVLVYRGAIRRIFQRALASAKAHEFVGNTLATGSIYADLLRMLRHLDEGGDWVAVNFTLSLLPMLLTDIEGFVSRSPPRNAVELITQEMDKASSPRFPISPMLAQEADTYSEWLTNDPARVEAKMAGLYRDSNLKPGLTKLLTLEPEEDLATVRDWVDGYRSEIRRLEAALVLPYPEAIQVIHEMDGMVAGADGGKSSNPLLPLLMLPMAPTYERYQAAEAHLAMVEVLLKAAIYRDFVGDWPDTSEILDQFSGGSLPRDPFTGEHVEYDLRGTLPRVQVDAPRNVKATAVADINLRGRVEADAEALAGMIRDLQRRQRMEEAADKKARAESNTKEAQNSSRGSRLRGRR